MILRSTVDHHVLSELTFEDMGMKHVRLELRVYTRTSRIERFLALTMQ